jgi:hypothetical protein
MVRKKIYNTKKRKEKYCDDIVEYNMAIWMQNILTYG